MLTKELLTEEKTIPGEDAPESSAFACEQCNKMYVHEDALAIGMTCCEQPLKELLYEASSP